MKITYLNTETNGKLTELDPCVLAMGFFDGVHLGHKQLLEKAKQLSLQKGLELSVLTFFPHPKEVLCGVKFDYLISLDRKIEIFKEQGVKQLFVVRFDEKFANLEAAAFVEQYLINLKVKEVVAGFDFTYGRKGLGNIQTLKAHGKGMFGVHIVPKFELYGKKVSSSLIRDYLKAGRVEQIPDYLGDNYQIRGKITVVHKPKHLRSVSKIGIAESPYNMLPDYGIYEAEVLLTGKWYKSFCHFLQKEKGKKCVEMEIPRNVKIENQEEVMIKLLNNWSINDKFLKQLNG